MFIPFLFMPLCKDRHNLIGFKIFRRLGADMRVVCADVLFVSLYSFLRPLLALK